MIYKIILKLLPLTLAMLACMQSTAAMQVPEPTQTETAAWMIVVTNTPPMVIVTETPPPGRCAEVTATTLYIRDKPDYKGGRVVGYLHKGQIIPIADSAANWRQVPSGYASAYYLKEKACP